MTFPRLPRSHPPELGWLARKIAEQLLHELIGRVGADGERSITLEKFSIQVKSSDCRERIEGVLRSFFTGMELAIKYPAEVSTLGRDVSPLYQPFFFEGAAMGYGIRLQLQFRSVSTLLERFEREAVPPDDPFLFLRYVGLGFWLGFRLGGRALAVERAANTLKESRYRHLVHDGYGFQRGFFGGFRRPGRVVPMRRFEGNSRLSAYSGLGRSLWFFNMDRPEEAFRIARDFGIDSAAVFGGLGLAATFTRVDQLERPYEVCDTLGGEEQQSFRKGMRIALYCRESNDAKYLSECVDRLAPGLAERVKEDLRVALEAGQKYSTDDEFIGRFHGACL